MVMSPEFEQAQAHLAKQLHHADFVTHKPEYRVEIPAASSTQEFRPLMALRLPVFTARVGKRPAFNTSHDAVQYERGFNSFPTQPWGLPDSPAMQGYFDAELAHADALAAKQERRTSDWAELA